LSRTSQEKLLQKIERSLGARRFVEALRLAQALGQTVGGQVASSFYSAAAMLGLDRCPEALKALDQISNWGSDNPQYQAMRGDAFVGVKDFDSAVDAYRRCVALGGRTEAVLRNLGNALLKDRRYREAQAILNDLACEYPTSALGLSSLSNAYYELELIDEAKHWAQAAIDLNPTLSEAWLNLSRALLQSGEYDKALAACEKAIKLDPRNSGALANLGILEQYRQHWPEARYCLTKAFQMSREAEDGLNLAALLLELGDFDAAWPHYELRKKGPGFRSRQVQHQHMKSWDGQITDQPIVLWGEQGIGDQILFMSCLPEILDRGATIILDIDVRLQSLIKSSFPKIVFYGDVEPRQANECLQAPLGDLLKYFRKSLSDFPVTRSAYLNPIRDSEILEKRFIPKSSPRCAVSWRSGRRLHGIHKSLDLNFLLKVLSTEDVEIFNVQYGEESSKDFLQACADTGVRGRVISEFDVTNDFEAMAAFLKTCDVVVSSSNSLLHLSGSVGANTIGILPSMQSSFWYWHRPLEFTPWYPTVHRLWTKQQGTFDPQEFRTVFRGLIGRRHD